MKVVLLSYNWGEYCIRIASGLSKNAKVCLILAQDMAEPHLSKLDEAVIFRPFRKARLRNLLGQIITIIRHFKIIRQLDPDVIHVQQGHFWMNFALPLLRKYPLVLSIHDPRLHIGDTSAKTPQWLYDFGFRQASDIIVHSKKMASVVINELSFSDKSVHVIPHVMLSDEKVNMTPKDLSPSILFFGRIWPYKGIEYLIRAEPLISAQFPEAKIVIAGQGENINRYKRMIVNPDRFIIRNEYISSEERSRLFEKTSVVVLPYIEATQSGVIPIAYSFEKPVVATSVGGLPEQVEHGRTGLLVPPKNEKALADTVIKLLQDQKLRKRLGKNGKKKLLTEWSEQAVALKTMQVYVKAASNR